jgi:predicted amidohydrolase
VEEQVVIFLKVAVAQLTPEFARPEINRQLLRRYCKRAARLNVDLIVFPELCVSGYNFESKQQVESLAEYIPKGPTTRLWMELASEYEITIVGGLAEKTADMKLFNSAAIVGPDGFVGCYRKLHLFGNETRFFSPGDTSLRVFHFPSVSLGVLVCFDWAFPEATRILMLEGCDLLAIPANLVLPLAQKVLIARSIENRIFTAMANRIGTEKNLTFTGQSQITDTRGNILARGPKTRQALLVAEIRPKDAQNKYLTPSNHIINDRRVDMYQRLLQK